MRKCVIFILRLYAGGGMIRICHLYYLKESFSICCEMSELCAVGRVNDIALK